MAGSQNSATAISQIVSPSVTTGVVTQGSTVFSQVSTGGIGPTGVGIPTGGNAGQILTKRTAADDDTFWQDPPQSTPTSLILTDANGAQWVFGITTSGALVTTSSTATNTFGNTFGVLTLG